MKKSFCFILISIILFVTGCESKSKVDNIVPDNKEAIKAIVPFYERKFIYTNGITILQKGNRTTNKEGNEVHALYYEISGLRDEEVQNKINQELKETGEKLLAKLEAELLPHKKNISYISRENINSYISYNCNNVIFVEFNVSIEADLRNYELHPMRKFISYGYDLNTGKKITFDDLFIPGSDYKTKINNYICQYLIENCFDDLKYERMSRPFQGIRENQSFSFGYEGLRIIFDENNDEFVNHDEILIPLSYIGDVLYIYDRYFDEGKSIFVRNKLSKVLLPNKLQYVDDDLIEEGNNNYYISIRKGRFTNVPNKDIEKKLNEMLIFSFDKEDFKKKANALTGFNNYAQLINIISIHLNAGGYFSAVVIDDMVIGEKHDVKYKILNYDFNQNKEMHLNDIFMDRVDIERALKKKIIELNYTISENILDQVVKNSLNREEFYFGETEINIHLPVDKAVIDRGQDWIWLDFSEIGIDNIKILN